MDLVDIPVVDIPKDTRKDIPAVTPADVNSALDQCLFRTTLSLTLLRLQFTVLNTNPNPSTNPRQFPNIAQHRFPSTVQCQHPSMDLLVPSPRTKMLLK